MKIVFMGTPSYATEILKKLLHEEDFEVVSLITQPDKPVGRKQILTPPDTKKYCLEKGVDIDIFQPKTLRDAESIRYIESHRPDFIVVAAFGQILPEEVLKIAPCINLHASILPKYRGASPIQAAILARERFSGVTSMLMDKGLDTGDMLGFALTGIIGMDAVALFEKLSHMAADLCVDTLKNFESIVPLKQYHCDSSYAPKITKADGLVDCEDAETVYAKYLAFIFWPGIYLQSGLKLKKIALHESEGVHQSGEILEIGEGYVVVGCKRGALKVFRVQPPSKKEMEIIDYIRGKRLGVGDRLD
ncbi:MAG: methionyl-tRNA formyltransferase [Sulfurospirillum sp.]|nr:MAG: methionyl-tRNA formyltransferase [Sulfurospirillum sp.]